MATVPYHVSGVVKNSFGDLTPNVDITFTISGTSEIVTSNTSGQYLIDLDVLGYNQGDTVTYSAIDEYGNELYADSFVISGTEKELDINLLVRTNRIQGSGNRDMSIANMGGEGVSTDNPFPIIAINTLVPKKYDYIDVSSATTSDTYIFKTGGSSGTTIATIKLTYTNSAKTTLSNVRKT